MSILKYDFESHPESDRQCSTGPPFGRHPWLSALLTERCLFCGAEGAPGRGCLCDYEPEEACELSAI